MVLSVRPALNLVSERQTMNSAFDPLHLVNTSGAFGSITRERHEIVVQGTRESDPDPDPASGDWETYTFPGKPTDPGRRPPQWAPYHLRLDWQLWFAAMSPRPGRRQRWLLAFLERVLDGDEATLSLVRTNPFGDDPPEQVRVLRYRYRYTTPEKRATSGDWWRRERVGTYVGPVSRTDLRARRRQ
jgi:hypothetical protein